MHNTVRKQDTPMYDKVHTMVIWSAWQARGAGASMTLCMNDSCTLSPCPCLLLQYVHFIAGKGPLQQQ